MSEKEDLRGAPATIGVVVLTLIFGGVVLAIYPGWAPIGEFLVGNLKLTEHAPAWVQAVGSVLAIIATALGIRWQIFKSKEHQERVEINNNIHMSETCLEVCNAIISIIDSKEGSIKGKIYPPSYKNISYQQRSMERLNDLQQTIRLIIMKDLPVDLLKSLFQLQKIIAIYKESIDEYVNIYSHNKNFLLIEHRKIKDSVYKEIRKILNYKNSLILIK